MGATSDKIDPVGTDDHFSKRSRSLVIGWTQVLGARDLCDISLGIDALSGYLTDPYKVVPVASAAGLVNVPEIQPDSRSRKSAIFKYGHYFLSRTALKTSYRYYWDDWSINAHTLDLSLDQRMGRNLILTPRLRYYRQGNADFFAYEFSSPGAYMSSDYRVSSFWSWLAGVGLTVEVSDGWSFNLAGTYTDQTGLDRLQGTATAVAGPQLGVRRSSRILGEGEGEDGEDEGEGGSPSISPADMKVLSFTAGFSFKF